MASIKNVAKVAKGDITRFIWKTASYPTLGNLTNDRRESIENKLGRENFDAYNAGVLSIWSNFGLYIAATKYSCPELYSNHPIIMTSIPVAYTILEMSLRNVMNDRSEYPGSFPGTIMSIPIYYTKTIFERAKRLDKKQLRRKP